MQVSDSFFGERVQSECCFVAVVGLPTLAVRDEGPVHHVASNKQEQAHRRTTMCCAPACPSALPTTSETLIDEAEGRKTLVSACSLSKKLAIC